MVFFSVRHVFYLSFLPYSCNLYIYIIYIHGFFTQSTTLLPQCQGSNPDKYKPNNQISWSPNHNKRERCRWLFTFPGNVIHLVIKYDTPVHYIIIHVVGDDQLEKSGYCLWCICCVNICRTYQDNFPPVISGHMQMVSANERRLGIYNVFSH